MTSVTRFDFCNACNRDSIPKRVSAYLPTSDHNFTRKPHSDIHFPELSTKQRTAFLVTGYNHISSKRV